MADHPILFARFSSARRWYLATLYSRASLLCRRTRRSAAGADQWRSQGFYPGGGGNFGLSGKKVFQWGPAENPRLAYVDDFVIIITVQNFNDQITVPLCKLLNNTVGLKACLLSH